MQARENNEDSLMERAMLLNMYPGSGYASETGGIMKDIRELNVETIQKYHRDYYRADNLVLIIAGKVDKQKLFNTLQPVEKRIAEKNKHAAEQASKNNISIKHERPWTNSVVPVLKKNKEVAIEFP